MPRHALDTEVVKVTGDQAKAGRIQFNGDAIFASGRPWCDPYGDGAEGDGLANDTQAGIDAIARAGVGGHVHWTEGTFAVDPNIDGTSAGLVPLDGQTWTFDEGALLKARPRASILNSPSIIDIRNKTGVTIYRPRIDGQRDAAGWPATMVNTANPGGIVLAGIGVRSSTRIHIIEPYGIDIPGDLVYVGAATGTGRDVWIIDGYCENAGRAGFTVNGGTDSVYHVRCKATGSDFAGLHQEPGTETSTTVWYLHCEAWANGTEGLVVTDAASVDTHVVGGDYYENGANGINIGNATRPSVLGATCRANILRGLYIQNVTGGSVLGVTATANGSTGIRVSDSLGTPVSCCESASNAGDGYIIGGTIGGDISFCRATLNTLSGISVTGDSRTNGCRVWSNGQHGIVHAIATEGAVENNYCYANGTTTNATYDNIRVTGNADNMKVTGNRCRVGANANKPAYGLRIASSDCDAAYVAHNDVRGGGVTGNLLDSGTNTIVKDNPGYVTENNGSEAIPAASTSRVTAHGLAKTPAIQDIQLWWTGDPGATTKLWVSSPSSSGFTINTSPAPGAVTAVGWRASIE